MQPNLQRGCKGLDILTVTDAYVRFWNIISYTSGTPKDVFYNTVFQGNVMLVFLVIIAAEDDSTEDHLTIYHKAENTKA